MKKLTLILVLTLGFAFGTTQVKADDFSVDCYSIAEAAEAAAGGDNFTVFSVTFEACYKQLQ